MPHSRKHIRWRNWDYSSSANYFVTICTKDKESYFGEIKPTLKELDPSILKSYLNPSEIGRLAFENWLSIPKHYSFVRLDTFILMPDHLHGIIRIDKPTPKDWNRNKFGPQKENLADVIRTYKASVKRIANQSGIDFQWQNRYHDRVVRDGSELIEIRNYILTNPLRWGRDRL